MAGWVGGFVSLPCYAVFQPFLPGWVEGQGEELQEPQKHEMCPLRLSLLSGWVGGWVGFWRKRIIFSSFLGVGLNGKVSECVGGWVGGWVSCLSLLTLACGDAELLLALEEFVSFRFSLLVEGRSNLGWDVVNCRRKEDFSCHQDVLHY